MRHVLAFAVALWFLCGGCTRPSDSGANPGRPAQNADNPFEPGTQRFQGYEWAAREGGLCDEHRGEFREGCEEYSRMVQESAE